MKFKAVIADVDGTLIVPTNTVAPKPTEELTKRAKKIMQAGIIFSLATARSADSIRELIRHIPFNAPLILDNGAVLYDPVKDLYLQELHVPGQKVKQVLDKFLQENITNIIYVDNHIRLRYPEKIHQWKISKIVAVGLSPSVTEKVFDKLSTLEGIQVTKSISGPGVQSVHITHEKATKGYGLEKLAGITGVKTEETIGIGDSHNDLAFLERCGLKIAMGNATEEIKGIADYTTRAFYEQGVCEALDTFFLNTQDG